MEGDTHTYVECWFAICLFRRPLCEAEQYPSRVAGPGNLSLYRNDHLHRAQPVGVTEGQPWAAARIQLGSGPLQQQTGGSRWLWFELQPGRDCDHGEPCVQSSDSKPGELYVGKPHQPRLERQRHCLWCLERSTFTRGVPTESKCNYQL